jgi:membrane protease YdiL (CAAX protease family)
MNTKAISGYLSILFLSFLLYSIKPTNDIFYGLLPVLMLIFPIIVGHRVKLRFSIKDLILGLAVSVVVLLPYFIASSGNIKTISVSYMISQLLIVSLPEEFFFRGFLQDSIGRNIKAILFVSLLFSIAHLPRALFFSDWISLLSFFPSIFMGWLYAKTNNILPGTVFHFLANLVYKNTIISC